MTTRTITGDDIEVGMTIMQSVWVDRRPDGVKTNVIHRPALVKSIVEYPDNRVVYSNEGAGIFARWARVEVVV
jgi:hypothetical protein